MVPSERKVDKYFLILPSSHRLTLNISYVRLLQLRMPDCFLLYYICMIFFFFEIHLRADLNTKTKALIIKA